MDHRQTVKISKFLSLVLRHEPERIGLKLDSQGWVEVNKLLEACKRHDFPITHEELHFVIDTNDKKRFALSGDGQSIRAQHGHTTTVRLGYEPCVPPEFLYHGTAERSLDSIRQRGLVRGQRQYVHLSPDRETAISVGRRHGRPVVLRVLAGRMHAQGCLFFQSPSGVWLTEEVAPEFLIPDEG